MADTFETTSASSEQNDKLRIHFKRKRLQQFGETSVATGFEAKAEQPSIQNILPKDSLRCMSPKALGANIAAASPEFAVYRMARTSRNYFGTALELKRSMDKGDLASMADLAWLLLHGREGLRVDKAAAFKLAQEGCRRGCPHSQGVLALLYSSSDWCQIADSVENAATARRLASCSAEAGSKYGQFALGWILEEEDDECATSRSATSPCNVQYALAAAQGLDYAQLQLAICGCSSDAEEELRLSYMAAAQGLPDAFAHLADINFNLDERVYWRLRALAAGHSCAKQCLHLELQRAARKRAALALP